MRISVVGGASVTDEEYDLACSLGEGLAKRGHGVVCGGLTGVMEAVCRGAREYDGETIGILPGSDPSAANQYVTTPIATGMGNARNPLVVLNGAATVAVDGGPGTLSEIAHSLDFGQPVAAIRSHRVEGLDGIVHVETPREAIDHVEAATGSR